VLNRSHLPLFTSSTLLLQARLGFFGQTCVVDVYTPDTKTPRLYYNALRQSNLGIFTRCFALVSIGQGDD